MREAANESGGQNGSDFILYRAELLLDETSGARRTGRQPLSSEIVRMTRASAEVFGRAILDLLGCERCCVAMVARAAGFVIDVVELGPAAGNPAAVEAMTQLALGEDPDGAAIRLVGPENAPAVAALGRPPAGQLRGLAGSVRAEDGIDLVFLAGWHPAPLSSLELDRIARAVRAIWTAARHAPPSRQEGSVGAFLNELIFPAFIVDGGLRLLKTNDAGRDYLLKGGPLQLSAGVLTGANDSVTRQLQQALGEAAAAQPERMPPTMVVPLSTERGAFAFAWIGPAWMEDEADRFLLVVPQVDPAAGAKRIASAFGLKWAEERIVACVLCGQPPSRMGSVLGLTEATVRTYTKRIMLKLGINRQVEFFLLYILTMSPFRRGAREPARAPEGSLSATGGTGDERPHDA
ncbi:MULTISPECIES: helix-turn-helix transcriptional regulator [unclassified Chelatococcus]|uniref:helix-turn-helix transcriptional regulator n=1 Tax=unclassified Chelatococcus TaxID=2638111 RepID=UPI00030C32DD|nr:MULTISPECIES: helix-turn-helix transcriptional regulator [unclassified Chelatococcus]